MYNLEARIKAIEESNMSLAQLNKVVIKKFIDDINSLNERVEMIMDTLWLKIVEKPATKEMVFVWEDICEEDEDEELVGDEDCVCEYCKEESKTKKSK